MSKARGWARAKRAGAHIMRLGAWYPIVDESKSVLVILNIGGRNAPIPRDLLEITHKEPQRFSVVYRSLEDEDTFRWKPKDVGNP